MARAQRWKEGLFLTVLAPRRRCQMGPLTESDSVQRYCEARRRQSKCKMAVEAKPRRARAADDSTCCCCGRAQAELRCYQLELTSTSTTLVQPTASRPRRRCFAMDSMSAEVASLSLLDAPPPQLNLAAIFIATLEEADSDARRAGSLQSLWEVLTEDCSEDERLQRMVSTTKAASSWVSLSLTVPSGLTQAVDFRGQLPRAPPCARTPPQPAARSG